MTRLRVVGGREVGGRTAPAGVVVEGCGLARKGMRLSYESGSVSFRGKFAADRGLTTRSCIMRQRSGPAAQPRAERGWSAGAPAKHFG